MQAALGIYVQSTRWLRQLISQSTIQSVPPGEGMLDFCTELNGRISRCRVEMMLVYYRVQFTHATFVSKLRQRRDI